MALPLIPIAVSFAKSQAAKFLAKRAAQRLGPKIIKDPKTLHTESLQKISRSGLSKKDRKFGLWN
jgi:hypothetical protein